MQKKNLEMTLKKWGPTLWRRIQRRYTAGRAWKTSRESAFYATVWNTHNCGFCKEYMKEVPTNPNCDRCPLYKHNVCHHSFAHAHMLNSPIMVMKEAYVEGNKKIFEQARLEFIALCKKYGKVSK